MITLPIIRTQEMGGGYIFRFCAARVTVLYSVVAVYRTIRGTCFPVPVIFVGFMGEA